MKSVYKNMYFLGLFLLFTCFISTSFIMADVKGDIKKSFDVTKGGLLKVDSDLGSIEVETNNSNDVNIEISFLPREGRRRMESAMEKIDVNFKHKGKNVTVVLECDRGRINFWDNVGRYVSVKFLITVPEKYNVDLQTAGGSISVDDLEGKVQSKTSGGGLSFGRVKGSVFGRTSGGSIDLDECDGQVNVNTSGGSINIGQVSGDVEAHTSGGGITVEEVMGSIDATTSGGSIKATISKQPKDDCRLTTSGGGITVHMLEDIKVNVNATTSGGRVRTDFPVTIQGEISKRSLRAKINGGGPDLYLKTSGGSIYLKEL